MAQATINGATVLRAEVALPLRGVWAAIVEVDAKKAISGSVTLAFADGLTLVGSVRRSDAFQDRVSLRMVGGAGGFRKVLSPKHYTRVSAASPIRDILTEAGESADGAIPDLFFAHWTRLAGTAGAALEEVVKATGSSWRVLANGKIGFGLPTWNAVPKLKPYDLIDRSPAEGWALIGVESPWLEPGFTFLGSKVGGVVHRVEARSTRTEVWFVDAA